MPNTKNFGYSLVATAPSPATSGTSLVVTAADGAKFPAVPFNATVWPAGAQPLTTNAEIVTVTNISTDTLTITRAQESSVARTVIIGDQIAATITAGVMLQSNRFTPVTAAAQDIVLDASTDFAVNDVLEVGAGNSLEVPATSSLEVRAYMPPTTDQVMSTSNHLRLIAGATKLVKTSLLRQDNGVNAYQAGNSVMLTGWVLFSQGAVANKSVTVTFGVTFNQNPIIIGVYGGDNVTATNTSYGSGMIQNKAAGAFCHTITTTSFIFRVQTFDNTAWGATDNAFAQWTAIGEIA